MDHQEARKGASWERGCGVLSTHVSGMWSLGGGTHRSKIADMAETPTCSEYLQVPHQWR
jgi:hypothetical protein